MTRRWRQRPSPWLVVAVALAHGALLADATQLKSSRSAIPYAPALLTRTIAAPEPPAATVATAAPPHPARHARPKTAAAKRPAAPKRSTPRVVRKPVPVPEASPPEEEVVAAAPDVAEPDVAIPDTVAPEPLASDAPASEASAPEAAASEAAAPEAVASEASASVAAVASASAAEPQVVPLAGAPVQVPASVTLYYHVKGQASGLNYQADAQLRWRHLGERYEAVWSIQLPLIGTRTQRSEGRIGAAGLEPEQFAENSRSDRVARIDAEERRIHFSANKPDVVLEPGAQDRLSVTLQFAALLAAAPERYPPGARIKLQTVGSRDAEPWTWEVLADEPLSLGGREMPSVHLLRQPRKERDTRVELWLARALGYLPVRLRLTQPNGDVADQQLQTLDMAPAKE